jgi:tetratricopeptide (TPR) repeat protein
VAEQDGGPAGGSTGGIARAQGVAQADVGGFVVSGVVAGDVHVHGRLAGDVYVYGRPAGYVFENWQQPAPVDPDWLRQLPSRLLQASDAVVPFVDRVDDLEMLIRWRDEPVRLSGRLLYGPAGVGKTRLANEFAGRSVGNGWKVVTVSPSPHAGDLGRAGTAARSLTDPDWQARALTAAVEAFAAAGDSDQAETVARSITDPYWQALALTAVAETTATAGDTERARQLAERAEAVALSIADPGRQARALTVMAEAVVAAGQLSARGEDLWQDGSSGLLLIVDYAETWPSYELTNLLSNSILYERDGPTRVLLLSRTREVLPSLRATAAHLGVAWSAQAVAPFETEAPQRKALFAAASDRFADIYQLPDVSSVMPATLSDPVFGLPVALLLAALAAVDARGRNAVPPQNQADYADYLLDRETAGWERLQKAADAAADEDDLRVREAALELQDAVASRDAQALDRSVRVWRDIVAAAAPGHRDLARRLSNLSVALQARFEAGGDIVDLDEVVQLARRALAVTPYGSPIRAERETNLAAALQTRYRSTGNGSDLEEAIGLLQAALRTVDERSARAAALSNLGVALLMRYQRSHLVADLDESVAMIRQAAAMTQGEGADHESVRTNLAAALTARFEALRDPGDFAEAATLRGEYGESEPR